MYGITDRRGIELVSRYTGLKDITAIEDHLGPELVEAGITLAKCFPLNRRCMQDKIKGLTARLPTKFFQDLKRLKGKVLTPEMITCIVYTGALRLNYIDSRKGNVDTLERRARKIADSEMLPSDLKGFIGMKHSFENVDVWKCGGRRARPGDKRKAVTGLYDSMIIHRFKKELSIKREYRFSHLERDIILEHYVDGGRRMLPVLKALAKYYIDAGLIDSKARLYCSGCVAVS